MDSEGRFHSQEKYDVGLANVQPCVPRCVRTFALFNYFAYIFVAFGTYELADETKAQFACHNITDCMSCLQAPRSTWMLNCFTA